MLKSKTILPQIQRFGLRIWVSGLGFGFRAFFFGFVLRVLGSGLVFFCVFVMCRPHSSVEATKSFDRVCVSRPNGDGKHMETQAKTECCASNFGCKCTETECNSEKMGV